MEFAFLDVVVRPDGELEFVVYDHAWPLRAGSSDEKHDPSPVLVVGRLQQRNGDRQRHARRPQRPLALNESLVNYMVRGTMLKK
jgi:hypothetical protein